MKVERLQYDTYNVVSKFIFRVSLHKKCTYKTDARKLISFYDHWPCTGILPVGNENMLLLQSLPSIPNELCLYSLSCFVPFAHFAAFQSSVIIPAFQAPQSSFPLCSKPTAGQRLWCYSVLPTTAQRKGGRKKQMALLLHLVHLCIQQISFQGFIPCILYCFTQFCLWAQRPESRAKVKSNSGEESKHGTLIHSAYSRPLWVIQGRLGSWFV